VPRPGVRAAPDRRRPAPARRRLLHPGTGADSGRRPGPAATLSPTHLAGSAPGRIRHRAPLRYRPGCETSSRSFQHATLVPDLTVFQNVQLAAENGAARRRGADVRAATAAALTMAGVPERLWHRPSDELNGGDQKLVDIARAFVGRPKVILLDEPTSGVTEAEIDGIASAIYAACREGITLLVIDHNIEFVRAIAHRVTVLDFGAG